MGDILNIAALHDGGLPRATFGIRGNRFRLSKDSNTVTLMDPITGSILNFRANATLSDASLVETHITDLESSYDRLYDMVVNDEYLAGIEVDDEILLIDDETEYPIVDNWSVLSTIADLKARIEVIEGHVQDLLNFAQMADTAFGYYDSRINVLEQTQIEQTALLTQLIETVTGGLDHAFIVDDA